MQSPKSFEKAGSLYLQLAEEIQRLIETRSLRAGERLPSVRLTARQRQISIGTVIQAYVVLENRGYVDARPKSGYYVRSQLLEKAPCCPGTIMGPAVHVPLEDLAGHIIEIALDPTYFPLGTADPDISLLPVDRLARMAASVGRSDPGVYGRNGMGRVYRPLAQELSRRYLQTGTALRHEDFIITSGCTEALHLALSALTQSGDVVLVESPAYFGFLRICASLGLRAVEVPVNAKTGLSLEALKVALDNHDAKALVVTPNFHNPTGACMPNARKEELYGILCDHDLPAVEDDIFGELHHGPIRPKPLKAWDRDGRVLLCSSLSKTLAPGLGLGWLAPGRYYSKVDDLKWSIGSMYVQKVGTRFMQEGYDRHLRGLRSAFRHQMAATIAAVKKCFPKGTTVTQPTGGFVFWVEFPRGVDAVQLRLAALDRKIGTAPGTIFSVRNQFNHCLRINCGTPWTPAFKAAICTLGELATKQINDAKNQGAGSGQAVKA
jgi:DNA-binding transcriptional MocR family regulator